MTNVEKSRRLRELIQGKDTLVMPDAVDPLSARVIEHLGFQAVQCSGFSMAVAAVLPTEADLGMEANLHLSRAIAKAVKVPVMADGEDGFGGPELIADTVHVINDRTDALAVASDRQAGLKEAAERANAYLAAGADLAFVTAVTTMEEVQFLVREIDGPLSIAAGLPDNLRTMSIKALRDAGVARVSLPVIAILSAVRAMTDTWRSIRDTEDFADILSKNQVGGMEDIAALLKRV